MKLRYTSDGKAGFAAVLIQLHRVNPFAAARFERNVAQALRRVVNFPRSCPHVPEFRDLQIREFFVGPYRFFYFIDEPRKTAWLVDVWHGAQIPAEPRLPAGREPEPARE